MMDASSLGPILRDPTLRYRLDPGEPGVRTDAPASQSAFLVTSQELRNQTRLTRVAIAKGEVVVTASSTFTPGIDGAYLSVRSGLTKVVTRQPRELAAPPPPEQPGDAAATAPEETLPKKSPSSSDAPEQKLLLQSKAARIARQLQALQASTGETTALQDPTTRAAVNRLETQQRQVEQALRQVQLAQIQESLGMAVRILAPSVVAMNGVLAGVAPMRPAGNPVALAADAGAPSGERINLLA